MFLLVFGWGKRVARTCKIGRKNKLKHHSKAFFTIPKGRSFFVSKWHGIR
jgi:hypothetical protein